MKILWLSHFVPYPPAGGALQRTYHLLRHVARQHEVHLLALNQPRLLASERALDDSIAALSELCASVRVFPIPAERSPLRKLAAGARSVIGREPYDAVWLESSEMAAATSAYSTDGSIDLVHVDTIGLWQYVDGWTRTPIVLGHHNIESNLILRRVAQERGWRAAVMKRDAAKLRELERRAAHRASMNLVVSKLDGDGLAVVAPGSAVSVVDNGVDTDYWQPGVTPGTGIMFAGTLSWYPNRDAVDFLLAEIWPRLLMSGGDHRLTLVGRDPPPSAIAAAADPRVQVTGFVPDVRPYFRDASIFVCPIRVGGGTRLKILDALAMARPLVSTAIGVEGLDLEDDTHYVRAETAAEFVEQIVRLQGDAALRDRLGRAGRRWVVERYDWRVIGRQLDAAYARAVGHRSSGAVA